MARRTQKYGVMIAGFDGIDQQMVNVNSAGTLSVAGVAGAAVVVGGPAVDGAAASGNPVAVGGIYNTTPPTYDNLDRTQLQMGSRGALKVQLQAIDGASGPAITAASADGNAQAVNSLNVADYALLFNGGTTWDRARNAVGAVLVNTGIGSTSVEEGGRLYNHITAAAPTATVVKSGPGHLHTLTINTPAATAVVTIYDNTAASGTVIGVITQPGTLLSTGPVTLTFDVAFTTGLTVNTATAAQDITVSYR